MYRVKTSHVLLLCLAFCNAGAVAQSRTDPDQHTLDLLRQITLAQATSGDEGSIRAIIRSELGSNVDIKQTPKGDLLAKFPGKAAGPVILLAAHMDEVGFQVRSITPDGFLTVAPLGEWYAGSMSDQIVTIHTSHGAIPGVVGVHPPHLMTPEDKTKAPGVLQIYIDIGASSAEQVRQWGVQIGDRIAPRSRFFSLGRSSRYVSKAWDDRVGCALLTQIAQELRSRTHPNTIYIAWTSSEEFGRSNATVEAPELKPDFVIVVEVGITADTPDAKQNERQEKLGGGPVLDLYDGSLSTTPRIRDWFTEQAASASIPLQYTTLMQEGFGVGAENNSFLFRALSTALLVPLRYAHSPHGVIDIHDYIHARELLAHVLNNLDASALQQMQGKE